VVGWYKLIGSTPTILFVEADALFLTFGNLSQRINDFCSVTLSEKNNLLGRFQLFQGHDLVIEYCYSKAEDYSRISPFEYLEEEDSDWGMFVQRIINQKPARQAFLSNLTGIPA
jgi:hypothetical protein